MGSFHDNGTLPEAAASLAAAFEGYYNQQKKILAKRRKDLEVLRSRAGFSQSTMPATTRKYLEGTK